LWLSRGALLVAVIGILILSSKATPYVGITPAQAYAKFQEGAFILVVRSQDEWNQFPIAGSTLRLQHLVRDYNGTLAQEGCLLEGVRSRLDSLADRLHLHVITADTFGLAQDELAGVRCDLAILPGEEQATTKVTYIRNLNPDRVATIGNGRNDRLMLEAANLSLAVMQGEGVAVESCLSADLLVPDILTALDLFVHPKRLNATLRS
jgi:soluble P-type ATPase